MQLQNISSDLAAIDRGLIEQRLTAILDLCARGDAKGVASYFTPDVVYAGGTWPQYPLSARREGREACADMIHAIHVAYESLGSVIEQIVMEGDRLALRRVTTLRNRGSGRTAPIVIWNFVRLRDGLICEYSEYPDTLAVAALDD